jgi:hypothetical protein
MSKLEGTFVTEKKTVTVEVQKEVITGITVTLSLAHLQVIMLALGPMHGNVTETTELFSLAKDVLDKAGKCIPGEKSSQYGHEAIYKHSFDKNETFTADLVRRDNGIWKCNV